MKTFNAYINGHFIDSNNYLDIISPSNNEIVGRVSALKSADIDVAFESASKSFNSWKNLSSTERENYLLKFNDLLLANVDELASIMNLEIAKPINEAKTEILRTVDYIKETINEWKIIQKSTIVVGKKTNDIVRVPLGVVLAISPFNYPVNLSLAKIAPALLAGNTVVFKPATNGSLTGAFLATLFDKVSLPGGVFNLVTGRGRDIGNILTTHPHIAMITFTGSVPIGKEIASKACMLPLVLELGGNDLAYVRHDANLDLAAKEIAKGAFNYSGQRCTAIKRLLVHKNVKGEFLPKLLDEVKKLEIVPLVSAQAADFVESLIDDSKKRNDNFLLSGMRQNNLIPAHIVETTLDAQAWTQEAFGPLLPIVYLEDETNLLTIINQTDFGLQNSIFTTDIKWAKELAINIESGSVNINASSSRGPDVFPFLGVKDSGFGVQGIKYALESMTRVLNIVQND